MRIYKVDGTFVENRKDTGFGWDLDTMVVTENRRHDKEIKKLPKPRQPQKEDAFLESVDIVEPEKPIKVKHVNVDIRTEPIMNVVNCSMDVEGPPLQKTKSKLVKEYTVPTKEELATLINPCNIETKALMSIICFAKYKSLMKEETSAELFKTVNFKTTNFKCLIKGQQEHTKEEMLKEIQHYYATNEDNMLSLMMELLLADIGCNLEDIVDIDDHISKLNNSVVASSVDNGMQCNFFSRQLSPFRNNNVSSSDRSSILSSIGLSDEDKSLQSICEETMEMRLQTAEIKESFLEEENRVNRLIKITTALREEVREANYLDDILHLLEGNLEKVKLKKLPFKIFYKDEDSNLELNLIV